MSKLHNILECDECKENGKILRTALRRLRVLGMRERVAIANRVVE